MHMNTKKLLCSLLLFFSLHVSYSQSSSASGKLKSYVTTNQQKLGVTEVEANNLVVTHEYIDPTTGIQHIYAVQKMNGLTITNTSFGLHTSKNKQVDASR